MQDSVYLHGVDRPARPIEFRGSSLDDLSRFPAAARRKAGFQLFLVQQGADPDDWKPMSDIGPGVKEIRIREKDGAFRVFYVAAFPTRSLRPALLSEEDATDKRWRQRAGQTALQRAGSGDWKMTEDQGYKNVWDALEPDPAKAENLKLRSSLMLALTRHIKA